MFRSHDFVVFRASLCNMRQFTVLFVMASHFASAESRRSAETAHAGPSCHNDTSYVSVGGRKRTPTFSLEELQHCLEYCGKDIGHASRLKFVSHNHQNVIRALHKDLDDRTYGKVPLSRFVANLTHKDIKSIAKVHGIHIPSKLSKKNLGSVFENHSCPICQTHLSVFVLFSVKTKSEKSKDWYDKLDAKSKRERQSASKPSEGVKSRKTHKQTDKRRAEREKPPDFPPSPPSAQLTETIIRGWSKDTAPSKFMEGGCAVCGQLTRTYDLSELSKTECDLGILTRGGMGVTRLERTSRKDPVLEVKGPVLDAACTKICKSCENSLALGLIPKYALANGLWLGTVPSQLQNYES
jgi:hypothetical protein